MARRKKDDGWDTFFKVLGAFVGVFGAIGTGYAIADYYDKKDRCPKCQQKMTIVQVGENIYNLHCYSCGISLPKN